MLRSLFKPRLKASAHATVWEMARKSQVSESYRGGVSQIEGFTSKKSVCRCVSSSQSQSPNQGLIKELYLSCDMLLSKRPLPAPQPALDLVQHPFDER